MNSLNKLQINPSKSLDENELINLLGGDSDDPHCDCHIHLFNGGSFDESGPCGGADDCTHCGNLLHDHYEGIFDDLGSVACEESYNN